MSLDVESCCFVDEGDKVLTALFDNTQFVMITHRQVDLQMSNLSFEYHINA